MYWFGKRVMKSLHSHNVSFQTVDKSVMHHEYNHVHTIAYRPFNDRCGLSTIECQCKREKCLCAVKNSENIITKALRLPSS